MPAAAASDRTKRSERKTLPGTKTVHHFSRCITELQECTRNDAKEQKPRHPRRVWYCCSEKEDRVVLFSRFLFAQNRPRTQVEENKMFKNRNDWNERVVSPPPGSTNPPNTTTGGRVMDRSAKLHWSKLTFRFNWFNFALDTRARSCAQLLLLNGAAVERLLALWLFGCFFGFAICFCF